MSVLIAVILVSLFTLGLLRLVALYDRYVALVEYGSGVRRCCRCGRRCIGVRHRTAVNRPWEDWCSECCGAELEVLRDG